ncbi:MAG: GDP-mannose 4,6-dehydratase [Phycisphaerales bacterium]|nr:GDP-mannose 4,6-dehydratase [Phycisphaerales bacterium]
MVTGAAGFIGSHVCEALLARGRRVLAVDCLDDFYDPALKRRTLAELSARPDAGRLTFAEADVRHQPAIAGLIAAHGVTDIIHLAARAGVRPSIEKPALYASVNVEGTASMLEAARLGDVRRFVLASSSSVYGNNPKAPFGETDDVSLPISPYAATKRAAELLGATHHALHGLPVACLRFFTVYGPRQRPDLAISKFMRLVAAGDEIPMFGNADTSRDYTYIGDIVAGVLSALDRIPAHGYRIWNLGSDRPVRLEALIDAIARTVGRPARIRHVPRQMGDVERTWADLSRSAAELGYRPATTLEQGLAAQWAWMRAR